MSVVLSLLIPTYNRENFLRDCLDSINIDSRFSKQIEIIISNNCSQDNTQKVLDEFQKKNKNLNIKIHNQEKHLTMMEHIHSIHHYASGKFCLIIGDDDLLYPHSISFILKKILTENFDVLYLNKTIKNRDLSVLLKNKQFELKEQCEFGSFADLVIPFGLISGLGFISSIVFKNTVGNFENSSWLATSSIYSNTYRFFSTFYRSKCIAVGETCVIHRQYNQRDDQLDAFFYEALIHTPKCLLKLLDFELVKPDQLCRITEECDPTNWKFTLLPQRLYQIIFSFDEKLKGVSSKDLSFLELLAQRMPSTYFSCLYSDLKNFLANREGKQNK